MTLGAAMHRTSAEANGPPIAPGKESFHARCDAEQGSARLLGAMRGQFLSFASRHGVTITDATLFCMNSEEPRR